MLQQVTDRIDLAHAPAFPLGALTVSPATRELIAADGRREVLEPRVMQVLVALVRAQGGVVSRDDLTHCCWDGRVVGEDAINRVLSRLRRVSEGIGQGAFRVETVTKVGYRLAPADGFAGEAPAVPPERSRRWMIGAGAAAAGAAVLGVGYLLLPRAAQGEADYPPEVAPLMTQGMIALRSGSTEGTTQAIGFFRRVTADHPDVADGWGALAIAYGLSASSGPGDQVAAMRERSLAAERQARELDSANGYAAAAAAFRDPLRGNWLDCERHLRRGLVQRPASRILNSALAGVLGAVGRIDEQLEVYAAMPREPQPTPVVLYSRAVALWAGGRLEEADRAMDEAYELFPLHFGVWFSRFFLLMYTGRMAQAIAMADDRAGRPVNIPDDNFTDIVAVARAMQSRDPGAIDAVMVEQRRLAATGSGFAQNAVQYASALGRLDDCFAILDAYYFNRGFVVPDARFPGQQRSYTRLQNRHTNHLFNPPMAAARADPRFLRLTQETGLERYWRESGTRPDYRR